MNIDWQLRILYSHSVIFMGKIRTATTWFGKAKTYVVSHKKLSMLGLVVLLGGGYWGYATLTSNDGQTTYALAAVRRETITVTVSGSGQVSASNQVDVKPKASGDVTSVLVAKGQTVREGQVIAYLDSRTAQKAVRDAEANLQSAEISLQKLTQPTDELSLIQAQNNLAKAQETKTTAENDLSKSYEDGFTNVANAFLDLPTVMTGLQDILYKGDNSLGGVGVWNLNFYGDAIAAYNSQGLIFRDSAHAKYQTAKAAYDKTFARYKATSRTDSPEKIAALIEETYETTQAVSEAIKASNNLIQLYKDEFTENSLTPKPLADTHLSALGTHTGTTNTHLSKLITTTNDITSNKNAIINAERSITENTQSLTDLKAGTDALDLKSAQLTVTQRKNALQDARETLADYVIRAPFAGTIAALDVRRGDSVSGGTAVATVITKEQLAEITLNEVDAATVAVGNPVKLTFDAIDGLTIDGKVAQIDTIGMVSQGVVSYTVTVSFNTQDDRIKSGMSVSADITTAQKENALVIPNEAIKYRDDTPYIETLENLPQPQRRNPQGRSNASTTPEFVDAPFDSTASDTSATSTRSHRMGSSTRALTGIVSETAPIQREVTVGLVNDTMTEVLTGVSDGQMIITKTTTSTGNTSQTSTNRSFFSMFGGPGSRTTTRSTNGTSNNSSRSSSGSTRTGAGGPPF